MLCESWDQKINFCNSLLLSLIMNYALSYLPFAISITEFAFEVIVHCVILLYSCTPVLLAVLAVLIYKHVLIHNTLVHQYRLKK